MLSVFSFMAIALAITGIVAAWAGNSQLFMNIIYTQTATGVGMSPIGWLIQLAPIFMVLFLSYRIQKMSLQAAQAMFWGYSVLMGLSLSPIFLAYTGESIARTFFISASAFGVMSIYGYSTKKDLTSFGTFLLMGVVGILIASLVNMFLASSGLSFAISVIGVILFTGLTAWDVQKLKNIYSFTVGFDGETKQKLAIHGALTLYLDFINLFIMMLRLFGSRRD